MTDTQVFTLKNWLPILRRHDWHLSTHYCVRSCPTVPSKFEEMAFLSLFRTGLGSRIFSGKLSPRTVVRSDIRCLTFTAQHEELRKTVRKVWPEILLSIVPLNVYSNNRSLTKMSTLLSMSGNKTKYFRLIKSSKSSAKQVFSALLDLQVWN